LLGCSAYVGIWLKSRYFCYLLANPAANRALISGILNVRAGLKEIPSECPGGIVAKIFFVLPAEVELLVRFATHRQGKLFPGSTSRT
jgi:hypothetical protein